MMTNRQMQIRHRLRIHLYPALAAKLRTAAGTCCSHIDDPIRREALQRSDWLAIVAILGIVVVLDDKCVGSIGPIEQRRPACGGEDAPMGYWCAGVTTTAPTLRRSRESMQMPWLSTDTGLQTYLSNARALFCVAGAFDSNTAEPLL
jgi:hypothetical protein